MPMSPYLRALRARLGNSLLTLPSVAVALFDGEGRLLMAREGHSGDWMTIGGAIEPGETPADAAVREMWEETGLYVEPLRVLGVFSGGPFQFTYPNGDAVAYVATLFEARLIAGKPRPDGVEATELRFVARKDSTHLAMAPHTRLLVNCAFDGAQQTYFAPPRWRPPDAFT